MSELWIWVGVELQKFRDWHLKKRRPKDLVFVLEQKEPFVTGSEGAGRFIGGEKSEDR